MSAPERIAVGTSEPYDVLVGRGALDRLADFARVRGGKFAVISDTNVAPLHLGRAVSVIESVGGEALTFVFEAGEASKSLSTLSDILAFLAESALDRRDCVIALGGGVVGDISALAAALYMRGIDYVQLPTSLLAAVDSSVGGKCAVDMPQGKNLVGVFKQPSLVLCDLDLLDTLPDAELSNGMGEVVKYGLGFDSALFFEASRGGRETAYSLMSRCVDIKRRVVEADEFDRGERMKLNLGHTAGHAIERLSEFTIPHGAAVAMGLYMMTRAFLPASANEVAEALAANGLLPRSPFTAKQIAEAALADKKRSGGTISLVVPTSLGSCEVRPVAVGELEAIFARGIG